MKNAALVLLAVVAGAAAHAAEPPGTGVHFVYFVRHGIYDRDNTAVDDRKHNGLNVKGHLQARLIGERLSKLPVHFDKLISSEFLRAAETADDIGKLMHMTPTRDAVLNECSPTSADTDASSERTEACDAARKTQWSRYFAPTPEHDTYDLLVGHGNVIRWTLLRAVGADTKTWPLLDSANGSLTVIAVTPDGTAHLVMYDDTGHLPVEQQTWSGRAGGWGAAK